MRHPTATEVMFMKNVKQQDAPSGTTRTGTTSTRKTISLEEVQRDADDMADQANHSEQTFDENHGIFNKM